MGGLVPGGDYGRRWVLRAILPSGIIALRHLPPAVRGARALVTSDGIDGTVPSGDGCGPAGVPGCGTGAAGSVIVFSSGQVADPAAASPATARLALAAGRNAAAGDGNARGR